MTTSIFLAVLVSQTNVQAQEIEWDKTYEIYDLHALQQTEDGGYILGGSTDFGESREESDFIVIKTDANGSEQWSKTLGGDKREELRTLQQTQDGGYILGGYSSSGANGDKSEANHGQDGLFNYDFWVVKLDANGNKQWDKTFGGNERDELESLQQTEDGGYILGGTSWSGASGDKSEASKGAWDYWVIKLHGNGTKEWDRTYGGEYRDRLHSIKQTKDGGYILGGFSASKASGDKTETNKGYCSSYTFDECSYDYWVVKLDADGDKQWDRTLGGSANDNLTALQQTKDGGYILGGYSESDASGDKTESQRGGYAEDWEDYWVVKLDASGKKEWDKTVGGESSDLLYSLQQTSDGGYILGGFSTSGISGDKTEANREICERAWRCSFDYWMVKLNAYGQIQWDKTLGGSSGDLLYALQQTKDGGFILGGTSGSGVSGDKTDPSIGGWVVKLSAEEPCTPTVTVIPDSVTYTGGDPTTILLGYGHQRVTLQASGAEQYEWSPNEGLSSTTVANPIFTPTDTGTYTFTVTGHTDSCSAEATVTITVIKPDIAGNIEWDRTFGGNNDDYLDILQQTSDGGYILGGYSNSGISEDKSEASRGGFDYWVIKLDANGIKEWDKTFGGDAADELRSIQQTRDGGYILGGTSWSGMSGDRSEASRGAADYWVIKLDANGNKEWDRTFGGDKIDLLISLQQTSDGGYILGGGSQSGISGDKTESNRETCNLEEFCSYDFWVLKLDASGNKIWDKTLGGDNSDTIGSLQQTSEGGYILGGSSYSGISGDKTEANRGECYPDEFDQWCTSDFWVVKIDASGNKEWDWTYGGDLKDGLRDLKQTSDGGYILGGTSDSGISGDKSDITKGGEGDYWVLKIDVKGNKEWDRTFGGIGNDFLSSLQQTNEGGFILGGYSDSGISGDKTKAPIGPFNVYDYWIIKVEPNGNIEWDRTIGGNAQDVLTSLQQTKDGGYVLGGNSNSGISGEKSQPSRGGWDYWVVKLYGEPCTTPTPAITLIPSSDVYTGGNANTTYLGYGPQSVQLVASGAERYEWSPTAGLSDPSVANPIFTPSAAGSYTFTLTAYNGACSATATVTIKVVDVRCGKGKVLLCHKGKQICISTSAVAAHLRNHKQDKLGSCSEEPVGEDIITITIPLKVFPNPFRDWTNIEFSLPVGGPFRLELYNAGGKLLGVVAEGEGQSGQVVKLDLRGEQLREGIYYLRLFTQDEVQTVRVILKN